MVSDQTIRIEELPNWFRALFRSRENDRKASVWIDPGLSVVPGSLPYYAGQWPYHSLPWPERYDQELEKMGKYTARRNRQCARPLRHLVVSKYAKRSGLALKALPVKAIKGLNAALAAKLAQSNINTVDDLAKASMKKIRAIGITPSKLAHAQTYAKDIIKHATMPQITEHPLLPEEMLKPKFARISGKNLPNLGLDAMRGIGKLTAEKMKLAGVAIKLGDLQSVKYNALVAAGASRAEASLMIDYSAMLFEWKTPAEEMPALGKLRVLIFDGLLRLGQSIKPEDVTPEDPTSFPQPEYPLDEPGEAYAGYMIVADEIVIANNLSTNGNDLVLVAKKIQVGKDGAITINTKPIDFPNPQVEADGLDADSGGDLVFLCQKYSVHTGCIFRTSGGVGQDGGAGRPMTKPDFLNEGTHFQKPRDSLPIWAIFLGMLGTGHCKFHVDPDEWPVGWNWRVISYEDYHNGTTGPAVNVTGEWTLWNGIEDAVQCYLMEVLIDDHWYPTDGRPGGYGGNPGKINLIIPDPSGVTGIDDLQIDAETGSDGAPGQGGNGGDCTPGQIRRGGLPVATSDYLHEYTTGKPQVLYRGEPREPFVGGFDRFTSLRGERLDSSSIVNRLEDSICGATFSAALKVLYAPSPRSKRAGTLKQTTVFSSAWPFNIFISTVNSGNHGSFLGNMRMDNLLPSPRSDSMGLKLSNGLPGEPKAALPTETGSLATLIKNWYQAVYEILPEYPLLQYKRADEAYRKGDFDHAAELYHIVLTFAQEAPEFQTDQATIVSDAGYRLDRISEGYDYFGFTADTVIPSSPTTDYFPLDLTTSYSDTVQFYRAAIRGVHDSIETIEMGKGIIRQFLTEYELMAKDSQVFLATLVVEMGIIASEVDAMVQEINALLWSNQRLSGLLQRWAKRVDDKIKELEKEKEDQGSGWWDTVIAIWNVVKLVAALYALVQGVYAAAVTAMDAAENLGELIDEIEDLGFEISMVVLCIVDMDWDQIPMYFGHMGEIMKEIDQWSSEVEKAWTEASKSLKEVEKAFEGAKAKIAELTAVDMSETEAIEFQNNVLLADEIDVSGAMDYLQIQEQIYLNNDMLSARYSSLQALAETGVKLAHQANSTARQLAAYKEEAKYLGELLEELTWNTMQKQDALHSLTKIGQHSLDAFMLQLARQERQLKYLNLDNSPSPGYYAFFIDSEDHVGRVLRAKDELIAAMNDWIEENSHIGRLKVVVTGDPNYANNPGGITILASDSLTRFTRGRYLRPSGIIEIEPLRETVLIERLGDAISNRRSDPGELARLLVSQFMVEEEGTFHLVKPEEMGFGFPPDVVETIISRERAYHPLLNTSGADRFDDTTVVLAYALARGGVIVPQLSSLLQQTALTIPPPLKSRIESLENAWVALSNDINGEQVASLRALVEAVRQTVENPAQIRALLDEALIAGGQFVSLDFFHLNHHDIQKEIADSYDPNEGEAVLARVYAGEPRHVVAAVVMMYAGLDPNIMESLTIEYATDPNPLSDCVINVLQPQWDDLRASVLESKHEIEIDITIDDYMQIPNAQEMFRELRYLAASAKIPLDIPNLLLEKLPSNLYAMETNTGSRQVVEFQFENTDDVVPQPPIATPLGLNIEDVHFSNFFGRSILGKWALSFTYKGNRQALPDLNLVELEFIHTYVE